MIAKNRYALGQLFRLSLPACLLLMTGLVRAGSDQLQKALVQTQASLQSLDQGDAQGAAAHAQAARSHVEIATRNAKGQTQREMNACIALLRETEQFSGENESEKAKVSGLKAAGKLNLLANPD